MPVAMLERAMATLSDTHIYAHVSYGGRLLPSLVRAALQNLAAMALALLLEMRARMAFERAVLQPRYAGEKAAGAGAARAVAGPAGPASGAGVAAGACGGGVVRWLAGVAGVKHKQE